MKILKKAQIEVSFNWIFVLIAGGAILFIFIMLARNQVKDSTEETSNVISTRLQSILSAIQQNPEGVQIQDSLGAEITFYCEEDGHSYVVKGSSTKAYLNSEIIFTPKKVGESKTIAWTQVYGSPYPVVQTLYFSDEKTQYIFEESAKEYYIKFPEQFERKLLSAGDINALEDQGFRKYIIIARQGTSLVLDSSIEKKSTIVEIRDNTVRFIYGGDYNSAETVPYADDATLFGAIISGDDKLYGCTMEKLMSLSRIIGEINLERAEMLGQTDNAKCKLFFYSDIPQGYIEEIIAQSIYDKTGNYDDLKQSMISLKNINGDMARSSCPTIY